MSEPGIEKKRRKRRRSVRTYVNANKPLAVPLAEIAAHFPDDEDDGQGDELTPQHSAAAAGNRRMMKPGAEKGTPMAPDPMCQPGPRELAFRHPDLRAGSTTIAPWVTLRTRQGDNAWGDRSVTYVPGQVGLASLATAGAAGVPRPAYNPASRPLDHIARNSATPPNGSHSTADPSRPPVPAMKNSDLRAEFKRMLFPGSGAR